MIKTKIEEYKNQTPKDIFDIGNMVIAEDKTVMMVIGKPRNKLIFEGLVLYSTDTTKNEDGLYEGDIIKSSYKENYSPFYGKITIESTNE